MLHPPDPEMRNPAGWGDGRAISQVINTTESSEAISKLQERKILRLCAVSYATAATIARLAFAVAR